MTNRSIYLNDTIYDYLLNVSLREPQVLQELRETTAKLSSREMQIAPEQGQFMAFLVELIGVRKALEVGVYTGYSSISVALVMPSDGKMVACDINEEWTQLAQTFWKKAGVDKKITLHLAPAIETLDKLLAEGEAGTFDFAFIDADKLNQDSYYEKALLLVRHGGLIILDNTLWGGDIAEPDAHDPITLALQNLNAKIHRDSRVSMSLVPIGDGLTLVRKR